mgnify:CR=1 FL=1
MKNIRIGSRESRLAVVQSEMVMEYIKGKLSGIYTGTCDNETTGDRILDRNLDQIGGKGLFVKELDAALMDGRSDMSVHSLKDMPAADSGGTSIDRFFQTGRSKRCSGTAGGSRRT